MFNRFYFYFIILLISCCEKESSTIIDEDGAIIQKPWLWRTKTCEKDYNGAFISTPVFTNTGVVVGATDDNSIAYLSFLNIDNGSFIWKQNYIINNEVLVFYLNYQKENILIGTEGRKLYRQNLSTGEYEWVHVLGAYIDHWISGIDSIFFLLNVENDPENGYPVTSAYFGNIINGNTELFLIPDLGELPEPDMGRVTWSIGGFRYLKPFKNDTTGEIMLLCYYAKQYYLPNSDNQVSQSYLGLYNFTKKKWVYDLIGLGDYNFLEGFTPTIIGDKVYHTLSGGVAECRMIYTGDLIWRNEGDYDYSFNGSIVINNYMIVLDNRYGYLRALDISTGNEVWHHENIFTASEMQQLNGVVYFAAVTKSAIYAVDAATGDYLWRLKSPDEKNDPYNSFMVDFCTVIPGQDGEKGRVVVSSFTHAYCYEAAR
jgi:outer membrane protein assembly factor BamB